jgi:hypothetical protein
MFAELRPWGFWGSLGWGLFAVAAALFAVVVYTGAWMLTHQLRIPDFSDAAFGIVAGIVASVAPVIVLVIAVKSRQYPSRGYFALGRIPRGHLVLGIGCLIALIVVFEAMERLLGIDAGSESVVGTYRAARHCHRGASYRGIAVSRLPAPRLGAIVARRLRHDRLDVGSMGRVASAVQLARHPLYFPDGADFRLDAPAQREYDADDHPAFTQQPDRHDTRRRSDRVVDLMSASPNSDGDASAAGCSSFLPTRRRRAR